MQAFARCARREVLGRIKNLQFATSSKILDVYERGLIASMWRFDEVPRLNSPKRAARLNLKRS